MSEVLFIFFFQAEDGIRDYKVTGVQTCALPIFTLDAFEHDRDAEIAVVGSPLVEQLVTAIRARGNRCFRGFLPPELEPSGDSGPVRIVVTNGTASKPHVRLARHRVLRLLARVVVSAGSTVE